MRRYLVTGATGALGSALVPVLLAHPDHEVDLLLRARDEDDLATRLRELQLFWGEEKCPMSAYTRLRAVRGDVTAPRLGMSDADYSATVARMTHLVHCAANVNMRMSEAEANRISVVSAGSIIALAESAAEAGQFAKLEFVSTLGVAGRKRGEIAEVEDLGSREFNNTYESSKAEAEKLVFEKIRAGLPVTVHRPSMVVGDSRDGSAHHFQIFYYILEFLSGRYTQGILPATGDVQLDTIPVDTIANALCQSSMSDRTQGKLLHLCTGPAHSLTLETLTKLVAEHFPLTRRSKRIRRVPLWAFRRVLGGLRPFTLGKLRRSLDNLPLLLVHLDANQKFQNTNSRAILSQLGVELPPPENYLGKVVDFYLNSPARRKK